MKCQIDRKIAQIDNKEPHNTFTDSMRSIVSSLSQSLDKISKIDNDISKIDKFTSNMRSTVSLLLQSINKVSKINNKIYHKLIKKFPNTYQLCNNDHNKFELLLKNVFIPMNTWTAGKDLEKNNYLIKIIFIVN